MGDITTMNVTRTSLSKSIVHNMFGIHRDEPVIYHAMFETARDKIFTVSMDYKNC